MVETKENIRSLLKLMRTAFDNIKFQNKGNTWLDFANGESPEKKCMSGWVRFTSRSICSMISVSYTTHIYDYTFPQECFFFFFLRKHSTRMLQATTNPFYYFSIAQGAGICKYKHILLSTRRQCCSDNFNIQGSIRFVLEATLNGQWTHNFTLVLTGRICHLS